MEENKVLETTIEEKAQTEETQMSSEEVVNEKGDEQEKPKPKNKILFVVLGAVAILLVSALIFVYVFCFKGDTVKRDRLFYIKDEEIYYTDLRNNEKIEITSNLFDNIEGKDLTEFGYDVPEYINGYTYLAGEYFNEETKQLFYPDKINTDDNGMSVFYKILGSDEETIKIDSDIINSMVSPTWNGIVYNKGEDQALYYHDLTEKSKIDSGVTDFCFSNDGQRVVYLTTDGDCYIWNVNSEIGKTKVAGSVYSIEGISEDFSVIYYMSDKDYDLIKYIPETEEKVKVAERISYVKKIYDTGEIYYTKSEEVEIPLWDYINDDWAEYDKNIVKPSSPRYPSYPDIDDYVEYEYYYSWSYETYDYESYWDDIDRYYEKCAALDEQYYADLEKYNGKSGRDELRETIKNTTIKHRKYSLYYYDGTEEKLVSENYAEDYAYFDGRPSALYTVYGEVEAGTITFSKIIDGSTAEWEYKSALEETQKYFVAIKDDAIEIEATKPSNFIVSEDEKTIYFADNPTEAESYVDRKYEIYKIDVSGSKASSPKLYDSDVSIPFDLITTEDGDVIYFKNAFEENKTYEKAPYYLYIEGGDMFINGKEIDYDVASRKSYSSESNTGPTYIDGVLYYYSDWDFEKQNGTLKMYKNGQKIKIADEVHDFIVTDTGKILYIDDYSTKSYRGTLKLYGEEVVKIDDDVNFLIKE